MDYFINYINGEVFDVGFGDEKGAGDFWLINNFGYGITSNGICILGKIRSPKIDLIKAKKITFIIDLNNYFSEIFIDEKKIHNFNIKI